jgi:hypothetical protein
VRPAGHRLQDRQTLRRHLKSAPTEHHGWIRRLLSRHDVTMSPILDSVKSSANVASDSEAREAIDRADA